MHPYGTDTNERRTILLILVPVSFWVSARFLALLSAVDLSLPDNLDWIFDAGSAAAWFGLFYLWMEKRGWKWQLLHRIGLVSTPDLNGRWSGELRSSYKPPDKEPFETPYPVSLTIRQTWTRIIVELVHSNSSSSRSDTGSLFLEKGTTPILVYTYWNEPDPGQLATMEAHSGTTELKLIEELAVHRLEGRYYNGRGRGNYGSMSVTKVS